LFCFGFWFLAIEQKAENNLSFHSDEFTYFHSSPLKMLETKLCISEEIALFFSSFFQSEADEISRQC